MLRKSLTGKTAVVTGAKKGMGYEIALELASRNATIIMADKLDQSESKTKIINKTCNENIFTQDVDLASFRSVRCFADNIKNCYNNIDFLINNAGVFCMDKRKTEDGFDGVMQANHLGPFLLTNLLLDLLKKSSRSRIIFVTSSGAFFHNMNVKKLTEPDYFFPHYISGALHYYNSKLCNMVASKVLALKIKEYNVTCNCLHPGMTSTDFLVSNANTLKKNLTMKVLTLTTKKVKDAADQTVFLATSRTVANVTGKYFHEYQIRREPKVLDDLEFCRDIWEESTRLCQIKD